MQLCRENGLTSGVFAGTVGLLAIASLALCSCSAAAPREPSAPAMAAAPLPEASVRTADLALEEDPTPPQAPAQPASAQPSSENPLITAEGGLGFTSDPGMSLLVAQANIWLKPTVAVAPILQVGVSNDQSMLAPGINMKGLVKLRDKGLEDLKPYVEGGAGLMWLKDEDSNEKDVGLFFDLGLGANYELNEDVTVGTGLLLDFMPGRVLEDRFIFGWKVVSLGFRF